MDSYDAVVYDLDGTLVQLDVDWEAARHDVAVALQEHNVDTQNQNLWELLERGGADGFEHIVERELARHEHDGARTSTLLETAAGLPHTVPTGICSLNCESACRLALDEHDIAGHIDAVVGRDTVGSKKPAPEPLLETLGELGVSSKNVLFIGDSERDELAADRAGLDFRYVKTHLDTSY
ncbi:HAD family hydrolase [Halovenus rubra]|uniref:HAD family hydrolase n=2 Tax=Halovenus rubra TaxID=869890 RepID=A0ABD5XAU3_9EURY|nr:HAD-IA family hydrolase [Halovenus rubra]